MNILVYDVAAENGGAASVLESFYRKHRKDKKNHYFYLISVCQLEETDNITVINVPEVKKSWIHRILFDLFGVRKYLKKYQIDEVLSLQNTIIPCFRGRQTVYEHNALPFTEHRFSWKEDRLMWIYQNVIGRMMIYGIRNADHVIVQTEAMEKMIAAKVPGVERKTEICYPEVTLLRGHTFQRPDQCIFFYPANSAPFKNHRLILEACCLLKKKGIRDYTVVFTLCGDETEAIRSIREKGEEEQINIQWVGNLPREQVFQWYEKSALVFPSYIETAGLPICEAIFAGCPVLLADCLYARHTAGVYEDAAYFHYDHAEELAECMYRQIDACRKGESREK